MCVCVCVCIFISKVINITEKVLYILRTEPIYYY